MNKIESIYINLPNNSILSLYKRQGLLTINNKKTKIHKDIASVIQLCVGGVSLYEAIQQYCTDNNNGSENQMAKKILLGILGLIAENKLQTSQKKINPFRVIMENEEDVFYPQSMHIELTKACNLNCYYCYKDSSPSIKEDKIPVETLLGIIQKLTERGLTVVELTGGEPLLHPNFIEILKFCCNNLSLVSIITNGTLVDENFIKKIKPFKNKIIFSISLDSHIESEHEGKSRVKGSFKKAVNAIRLISKENMIVRASMAVDYKNWSQIEDTLLFAKSIGATKFTYSPIIPVGRANNQNKRLFSSKIPISEVIDYEKHLMNSYSDFLHIMDDYSMKNLSNYGGCGVGHRTFVMNPQGIIRLCATFENGIIGDALKQSIKEIFSNPLCALSAQVTPPTIEICKGCQYFSFCMGCSLRAIKGIEEVGIDNCSWLMNDKLTKEWFMRVK